VADAGETPKLIGANTCAATLMIGEKAADLILGVPALRKAGSS
jgi:choline dehydrogenase-like flavoprotein